MKQEKPGAFNSTTGYPTNHFLTIKYFVMKTIAEDSELSVELQELYILSNHWLSDIHFAEDEMKFLKHVVNKYLGTHKGNIVSEEIVIFNKTLEQQEATTLCLKNKILDLLKFIGPFVKGTGEEIGLELVEKFAALEIEVKALFESVKQLKKSLFSFTEEVMRTACEDFTRQLSSTVPSSIKYTKK